MFDCVVGDSRYICLIGENSPPAETKLFRIGYNAEIMMLLVVTAVSNLLIFNQKRRSALNRDEKSAIVAELHESFNRAKFAVVTDYCGLTVSEIQQIRIELRKCDSEIRVAKNTLLKRAVTETDSALLSDDFTGTTAVVMAYGDPVAPAKALAKFAEDYKKFQIRSAALEGERLNADQLIALSKLPAKGSFVGSIAFCVEQCTYRTCSCAFGSSTCVLVWIAGY